MSRMSNAMRDALFQLACGWRWGISWQTERALVSRGWVVMRQHRIEDWNGTREFELPYLTDLGWPVAFQVRMNRLAAAGARPTRHRVRGIRLDVVQGGRA